MAATYKLLVDWRDNGFADLALDDVTGRTLDERTTVTAQYGRDQNRQLSPTSPGLAGFELDNRSLDYSPENTASPLAGYIAPGRHVQLQATNAGSNYTIYDGYIDNFDIKPGLNERSTPVTCIDALGRFKGVQITTSLYRGIRTGDAVGYVLDALGWPTAARDLDPGASLLPYWWLDSSDAYDALMQLADSEGPAALITVDSAGRIVFRDRHSRLTRAASLNVQSTWRSVGIEPVISDPVTYNHGWSEIINSVSIDVPMRQVDGALTAVWSTPGLISIPPGTPLQITATATNPFQGALTPVQDVDYVLVSGSVTPSIDRTSGQSTTVTLTAAGGAVIQDLQLRAYAIQATNVKVTAEDAQSIAKYGRKSYQAGRLPVWANIYDAQAILQLIVAKRAERLPTITVTMKGAGHALRLAECLTRNLGDRIHLAESLTGLDSDCFVEQIRHEIDEGGLQHVTTFGLEKIPPTVTTALTFDVAGRGFNDGTFGGGGLDNPSTMLRFDVAGVGFDQGVFAN